MGKKNVLRVMNFTILMSQIMYVPSLSNKHRNFNICEQDFILGSCTQHHKLRGEQQAFHVEKKHNFLFSVIIQVVYMIQNSCSYRC